jgi:hypothetical protein
MAGMTAFHKNELILNPNQADCKIINWNIENLEFCVGCIFSCIRICQNIGIEKALEMAKK